MTVTKLRCIYLLSEGFLARLLVEIIKERSILPKKNSKFGMKLKRDKIIFTEHDVSVLRHFSQD